MKLRRKMRGPIPCTLFAVAAWCCFPACDDGSSLSRRSSAIPGQIPEGEQCEFVPAPRWALRDRDGNRVQALVEPRCGDGFDAESWSRCNPVDPGSSSNFPCVRIIDHEGNFINLQYDLESGQLGPCRNHVIHEDLLSLGAVYLNAECEGTSYAGPGSSGGHPQFTTTRVIRFTVDDIWYMSEPGCLEEDVPVWGGVNCEGPFKTGRICPVRPVPDWVKNLLPNPPYTMAVEYE